MITLENLENWLNAPAQTEWLEFKEAKQQFDTTKLLNQQKSVLTQIELLELDKSGIHLAQYITALSLKELLQVKLQEAIASVRRRIVDS